MWNIEASIKHNERKEIKKSAYISLKKHYIIFVAACLFAAFLGTEFSSSLNFIKRQNSNTGVVYSGIVGQKERLEQITVDEIKNNDSKAKATVSEAKKEQVSKENKILGRSNGVFAAAINTVSSGEFILMLFAAMKTVMGSNDAAIAIIIVMGLAIVFLFWFYINNTYQVVMRRIFLEGRIYENVGTHKFLYLFSIKKWTKAALTMFIKSIYYFLWALTIIGGIVKYFSYFFVPYIVAENPDIAPKKAITLSRKMMKGHKWECFVLCLSFIGWNLLNIFSLGILGILYLNPFKTAVFTEYYVRIRSEAKEKNLEGSEYLNDTYLYEVADENMLGATYEDVYEMMIQEEPETEGIRTWLIKTFGVTLVNGKYERAYEAKQEANIRIRNLRLAAEGKAYPGRLAPIKEIEKRKMVEKIHYLRHYTIFSLIMMFFVFSFAGWMWEVIFHIIIDGKFVNRGMLHGPWVPIYGAGAMLILVVLNKLRKHPVVEFFAAIVLCGVIEYFTAYIVEEMYGERWWEYGGYFLNLDGRVCAEGLLVFGVGGVAAVYFIAPLMDNAIRKISNQILIMICAMLVTVFMFDLVYSAKNPNTGEGITDYETKANYEIGYVMECTNTIDGRKVEYEENSKKYNNYYSCSFDSGSNDLYCSAKILRTCRRQRF